jgi:hypothetical protein
MEDMNPPQSEKKYYGELLLHPNLVGYLDFQSLLMLPLLSKYMHASISTAPENIRYWPCMCRSFALEAGLYSRYFVDTLSITNNRNSQDNTREPINPKQYFFANLWSARRKFPVPPNKDVFHCPAFQESNDSIDVAIGTTPTPEQPLQTPQQFSVRVVCRFRPGEVEKNSFSLPLHQFLKLKRKLPRQQGDENAVSNSNSNDGGFVVGEQEPPEFLDPFMHTLMREPVLLTTSNRIVDRSIALHALQRTHRDPFNNKPLTNAHQLVPQVELQQRIQEWKVTSRQNAMDKLKLTRDDVRPLVDEACVLTPEMIQALMDCEQLNRLLQKAERASRRNKAAGATGGDGFEDEEDADNVDTDDDLQDADPATDANNLQTVPADIASTGNADLNLALAFPVLGDRTEEDTDSYLTRQQPAGSKVVDVNAQKAVVAMQVHGTGVTPFHFSSVHGGADNQQTVYDHSIKESIEACLNGFNATILCYGQTGNNCMRSGI